MRVSRNARSQASSALARPQLTPSGNSSIRKAQNVKRTWRIALCVLRFVFNEVHMSGITLLGLGPGDPNQLTREAWDLLSSADEIYLRTRQHPTVAGLPLTIKIYSFDDLYEDGESFVDVYSAITQKILELGRREGGVIYAVPGHPLVAEATCPEIARLARDEGLAVRIVEGLSFLEPTFSALSLDPYPQLDRKSVV